MLPFAVIDAYSATKALKSAWVLTANREVNMGFPYGDDIPEYERHVKQIPLVIS
mgnify:CR=1 FL=1